MDPLVSIVIPAYNAEKWVRTAVRSALDQTVKETEVIVVDDASTDQTTTILQAVDDERLRVLRHEHNRGQAAARNTALAAARGTWVAFLDADDAWLPDRLAKLLAVATTRRNAFVSDYLLYCASDSDGELRPIWSSEREYRGIRDRQTPFQLVSSTFVQKRVSLKPLAPMNAVRQAGLRFPEGVPYAEDFAFWMGLYRIGLECWIIPEGTYLYRLTPGSMSTLPDRCDWEVRVIKNIIAEGGFDCATLTALKERMIETNHLKVYGAFATALKQRRVWDAGRILLHSPRVLSTFFAALPRSVSLRLSLRRIGGTAR